MSNMKVTAAERDLIEQIRNYNISYPNGLSRTNVVRAANA